MKRVDSQALVFANRALGISGVGPSTPTEFVDGTLDQVIDVASIVRRGRTFAGTSGIFTGILQNVHPGAGTLGVAVNIYNVAVGAIAPFRAPMPADFDIWLLSATTRYRSGTGTFEGVLEIDYPASSQGFGVDDSGVAVVATNAAVVAWWDASNQINTTFGILNQLGPYAELGIRLPHHPNTRLVFRSTASALATFEVQVVLGVFPVSLGQDGLK